MLSVQKIGFQGENSNLLVQNLNSKKTDTQLPTLTKNELPAQSTTEKISTGKQHNKAVIYGSSIVAIAAAGITTIYGIKSGRLNKKYSAAINEFSNELQNSLKGFANELNELKNLTGSSLKNFQQRIKDLGEFHDNWIKAVEKKADQAINKPTQIKIEERISTERNLASIDGLNLLQNLNNKNERKLLPENLAQKLQKTAEKYINGEAEPITKLNKNSTVWSLTAESIPEKEGGLGEVPVQIAKNLTNELGIDNYLVRPLNEIKGLSKIVSEDGKYTYQYGSTKMPVDKVMEFKMPVYRNSRYYDENVEIFYGIDPTFNYKRLMFKNDTYFSAKSLYESSQAVSETERYAFFPKAVYEFLKIKHDPNSMTSYTITNKALFDMINPPDAMIANDWHAAAMPALTKLKAPVEAAMGDLNKKAAQKIEKMNIVEFIHNADYQGTSWAHSSEILNTLFDKYALDIYENANSGFMENGIQKVLTVEGGVNLANLSAMCANKLKPVSPTYAKELAQQFERSRSLQHVFDIRLQKGTMKGHSNGWDKSVNAVSLNNLNKFNENLNKDKCMIFQSIIENIKGLSDTEAKVINDVFKNIDNGTVKYSNFSMVLDTLKKLNIKKLDEVLEQLDKDSIIYLRAFKPVSLDDGITTVMENRLHNKEMVLGYLKRMVDYNRKTNSEFFNIKNSNLTDLSGIDWNKLDEIPVINMGTRFCDQKGIDIACGTIESIINDWNKLYPNRQKPIFIIGGVDSEGGKYRNMAMNMKQRLGEKGKQVVYMDGFLPNNILQAGSDFTWFPSHFEPDGSKWESLYKGTPVIATRVGGHVDSITDGFNGFLTRRTIPQIKESGYDYLDTMVYDFKEANLKALNTFFDKTKYTQMVENSLKGDASWLIKDKDGKITGGALLEHMQDLGFEFKDFPQISEKAII